MLTEQSSYVLVLLSFLDQSASIFLFWLNKSAANIGHPDAVEIRKTLVSYF
jgi:hypothetical protein